MSRLDNIRWCPVQFQAFVEGINVGVDVVDAHVFATSIRSNTTYYRYAGQLEGTPASLERYELADDLMHKCIALGRALGLAFVGIDLKITPLGEVYCFEVNPMPAFSYYQAHTGQPIAQAVAQYLSS